MSGFHSAVKMEGEFGVSKDMSFMYTFWMANCCAGLLCAPWLFSSVMKIPPYRGYVPARRKRRKD
jgi:hypothetical protein